MLTISKWASRNKWTAHLIIVTLDIVLIALGSVLGLFLFTEHIFLPAFTVELACIILLLAFWFYPKKGKDKLAFYYQRIRFDAVIYGTAFVLSIFFGNQLLLPENTALSVAPVHPQATFVVYKATPNTNTPATPDVHTQLPKKRINKFVAKRMEKIAKKMERKMQRNDKNSDGLKALGVLLIIAMAIAGGYGILLLSCSLSCSGQGAAAVLVLVLGFTGLLIGVIALFKVIFGTKKKQTEKEDVP